MNTIKQLVIVLMGIWMVHSLQAFALDPIEEKLRQRVALQQPEALALLAQLVNINSGTENVTGAKQVGNMLAQQLHALGFETHWVEEPASMHRAGTLIASRRGTQGKRLLLIGHLDTVFSPQSTFQTYSLQGSEAIGPGVSDDKGGDVVMLYALKALAQEKLLDNTSITIVLTGDEENSGKPTYISRKPLIEAAKNKEVALDFEPSEDIHKVSIGRRGISTWTMMTKGKEGHSSAINKANIGAGAIFELTRIIDAIQTQLGNEKNLSFNPSLILGGTQVNFDAAQSKGSASGKHNVVAQTALSHGDLRYLTLKQKIKAKAKIQAIVAQHLPLTSAKITFEDGIPPMEPTEHNGALAKMYDQISQTLGYGAVTLFDPGVRGAGDISYVASIIPANLAGLGPEGIGQHSEKETLSVKSLEVSTVRAAILIYRLTYGKFTIIE